jgi:putative ATPase
VGQPRELTYLLQLRGEEDLRFDRVLARNPLAQFALDDAPLRAAAALLREDGFFVFAQVVPRHGQRLYDLIEWAGAPPEQQALRERVVAAEEAIYEDEDDVLVSWQADDLQQALQEAGLETVTVQRQRQREQRRLTERHLQRWFQEAPLEDGRATYDTHLQRAGLTTDEIESIARLYRSQLQEQIVEWQSTMLLIVAQKYD